MSRARSCISRRTPCNTVTRKPCDTVVEESPSVLALIQKIILSYFLYKAIQILTFILCIIPFFTRKPNDTTVKENLSVSADIQHIILSYFLYKAIRILTFILFIILFFTHKPNDTTVKKSLSVSANIRHIILLCFLFNIEILTFILCIIPFFLNVLYRAITSPSNPRSPTPLPSPNITSPTPRKASQSEKVALPPTTRTYNLRSHAAGSLIKSQGTPSVHGMCLRGGKGMVDYSM